MKASALLAALAALAMAPCAQAQTVTLPQVNNAGSAKVASTGAVMIGSDGKEKGTSASPVIIAAAAAANSTPCIISATTTAVTITPGQGSTTQCAASGSAGAYTIGAFTPQPGFAVRLVTTGTWTGSIAVGTSVDSCATINPLTVAGSTWGTYTGNANEAVDVPPTTGGVAYCLSVTVTSGTMSAALRQ